MSQAGENQQGTLAGETPSARATFVDPHALQAMGSMQLRARAVVDGVVAGLHRNPHRGSSVEFAEYKEYVPGDDIRHIDWRAYGRIDRYYVKQFEDETNLLGFLAVDISPSMEFRFEDAPSKRLYASTLAASLAQLLLRQGDAPGLITFDAAVRHWLPPSNKRTQLDDLCSILEGPAGTQATDLGATMATVGERVRKRALIVIVSDFLGDLDAFFDTARVLRKRGAEVVLFQVLDRAELELPWEGPTHFEGLEGEDDLLADPDALREDYQAMIQAHLANIRQQAAESDIETFMTLTDSPMEEVLLQFISSRQRRR